MSDPIRLLILDAAPYRSAPAAAARRVLADLAVNRGWTPRTFFLPDLPIADCVADFKCWTRTPGVCAIDDANRDVARAFIESDIAVFLTPVTFGGYASDLKKALDHLIPNILPFFETVDGETHHGRRYARLPTFLALGLAPAADPEAERTFHALAARNALNIRGARHASVVLRADEGADAAASAIIRAVEFLASGEAGQPALALGLEGSDILACVDGVPPADRQDRVPQQVVLLVGSPGAERSTSASLGAALVASLERRGVPCETRLLYREKRSAAAMDALLTTIDRADLLVLAAPLYVDSLPAPVMRLLEQIAARRAATSFESRPGLVAMVNCGFPEVQHNYTALAICRGFARAAGFRWTGGLALGGGGMVGGRPLSALGGRGRHLVRALDLTAGALASGQGVPAEAVTLFGRKTVPYWLYRWFGDRGFRRSARRHGVADRMRDRPYGRDRGPGTGDRF